LVADTLKDAQAYAEEALAWLVDDLIVAVVTVTVERRGNDRLNLRVTLTEQNGETLELDYENTWGLINAV
jgi:phage gp46-like protein